MSLRKLIVFFLRNKDTYSETNDFIFAEKKRN